MTNTRPSSVHNGNARTYGTKVFANIMRDIVYTCVGLNDAGAEACTRVPRVTIRSMRIDRT